MLKITSPFFVEGGVIPSEFTCDGKNISPPLEFSDIPSGTKSLALIVDDPDSPGGTFTHWLMFNITPDTLTLKEGSPPAGSRQGQNSFGHPGYGGPCPHQGEHRYVFTLYALDSTQPPALSQKPELMAAMQGHILEQATLTGKYQRSSL